jgi:signal transduction histidine kinase
LYRVDADTAEADVDLAVAPDGMLIEKEVDLDREDEEIPLAETPAAVRETIRRELGDLAPRITTKLRRGKLVYEVDAAVQGRGIEINVFEDGSVRNKYVDIDLADAPDPVRRAVEEALGDLPVDEVRRFVSGGTVLYEVEAEADGKEIELEFAPDGTAVDHDGSDVFPRYPLPDGEGELRLLLSASALTAEMDAELARFGRALLVVGPLALLACGLVLALLIRWQLRPLARMARQASGIGPANLRERIGPVGSSEECARLREAINSMIERLAEGLEREQRFAASAAHELRTPIAQLKTATEVAFLSERDASEYRQVLRENLDDIDRLEKLVTALLELSRRRHATEVRGRPVSLRALLVRTLEAYEGVSFPEELRRQDILVEGDADLLRAALSNVIDNARRYAPGAPPTIDLQTAGDVVVLVVADRGPGVGPADRERIFEPLARLQPAPAAAAAGAPRPDPGFGLGLAVARSTLRAFGGDLGCRARRDGEAGAEFVFSFRRTRLPAEASPGSRREH